MWSCFSPQTPSVAHITVKELSRKLKPLIGSVHSKGNQHIESMRLGHVHTNVKGKYKVAFAVTIDMIYYFFLLFNKKKKKVSFLNAQLTHHMLRFFWGGDISKCIRQRSVGMKRG